MPDNNQDNNNFINRSASVSTSQIGGTMRIRYHCGHEWKSLRLFHTCRTTSFLCFPRNNNDDIKQINSELKSKTKILTNATNTLKNKFKFYNIIR